jgi:LPXTG-motif cell wall-anchored protein
MHVVRTPYGNMIVGRNGRPIRGAMRGLGETLEACNAKCPRISSPWGGDLGPDPACLADCNRNSDTGIVQPVTPPPADQINPSDPGTYIGEDPWGLLKQPPADNKQPPAPNPLDPFSILTPQENQPSCPSGQQLIAGQCVPNPLAPPTQQDTSCPQGSYNWLGQCIPNPVAPPPKGNETCQNGTVFDSLLGGCSQSPPFAPPQGQPPLVTSDGCQPGQYKAPFFGCLGTPTGGGTTPPIRNCPDGTAPVNGKCAGGVAPNPPNALCPDGKPASNGKCAGGATAYTCPDNSYPVGGRCPGGAAPVAVAASNNTTMWILLGVGVVAVGGGAYLLLRKKKSQTQMTSNRRRRHYRRY